MKELDASSITHLSQSEMCCCLHFLWPEASRALQSETEFCVLSYSKKVAHKFFSVTPRNNMDVFNILSWAYVNFQVIYKLLLDDLVS